MKKLTELQVLKSSGKLLGCTMVGINVIKGMMFLLVHYPGGAKIVAKGDTLEALWKDILAYSKSLMK